MEQTLRSSSDRFHKGTAEYTNKIKQSKTYADCQMAVLKISAAAEIRGYQFKKGLDGIGFDDYHSHLRNYCPNFIKMQEQYKKKDNRSTYGDCFKEFAGATAVVFIRDVLRHPEILKKEGARDLQVVEKNYINVTNFYNVFVSGGKNGFRSIFNSPKLSVIVRYERSEFVFQHFLSCVRLIPKYHKVVDESPAARLWVEGVKIRLANAHLIIDYEKINNEMLREAKNIPSQFFKLMGHFLVHPPMFNTIMNIDWYDIGKKSKKFYKLLKLDELENTFLKTLETYPQCERLLNEKFLYI